MTQTKDEWITLDVKVKETDHRKAPDLVESLDKALRALGSRNHEITWFWGTMPSPGSARDNPAASAGLTREARDAAKRRSDRRRRA